MKWLLTFFALIICIGIFAQVKSIPNYNQSTIRIFDENGKEILFSKDRTYELWLDDLPYHPPFQSMASQINSVHFENPSSLTINDFNLVCAYDAFPRSVSIIKAHDTMRFSINMYKDLVLVFRNGYYLFSIANNVDRFLRNDYLHTNEDVRIINRTQGNFSSRPEVFYQYLKTQKGEKVNFSDSVYLFVTSRKDTLRLPILNFETFNKYSVEYVQRSKYATNKFLLTVRFNENKMHLNGFSVLLELDVKANTLRKLNFKQDFQKYVYHLAPNSSTTKNLVYEREKISNRLVKIYESSSGGKWEVNWQLRNLLVDQNIFINEVLDNHYSIAQNNYNSIKVSNQLKYYLVKSDVAVDSFVTNKTSNIGYESPLGFEFIRYNDDSIMLYRFNKYWVDTLASVARDRVHVYEDSMVMIVKSENVWKFTVVPYYRPRPKAVRKNFDNFFMRSDTMFFNRHQGFLKLESRLSPELLQSSIIEKDSCILVFGNEHLVSFDYGKTWILVNRKFVHSTNLIIGGKNAIEEMIRRNELVFFDDGGKVISYSLDGPIIRYTTMVKEIKR